MRPVSLWGLVPALLSAQAPPTWEELEVRGAVVSEIVIQVDEVFDPANPKEAHRLGRWANALHRTTRPWVVQQHLVFREGEPVSAARIRESERALRAQNFTNEAGILPELMEGGRVRARVWVRDAWTLLLLANYKRVGGAQNWSAALLDRNFLGTGKSLSFWREKGLERTSHTFAYDDPKLFGSTWSAGAHFQRLSDGQGRGLYVGRPFFALDTPWSFGLRAQSTEWKQTEFMEHTDVQTRRVRQAGGEVSLGWRVARDATRVQRLEGVARVDQWVYGDLEILRPGVLPVREGQDRRLHVLALRWSLEEDRFKAFRDLAFARRLEDVQLGMSASVEAGLSLPSLGADRRLPVMEARLGQGWMPTERTVLLGRTSVKGRLPGGAWEDGRWSASLVGYHQAPGHQTLAGRLALDAVIRPDFGKLLYLGGSDGFRGYRNFWLPGDRRWLLSMEDRLHTEFEPWGLARIGFVAFADVGAVRRLDTGAWSPPHGTFGAGLRIAVLKSGLGGAFNITVAVPTRKGPDIPAYQILVGSTLGY